MLVVYGTSRYHTCWVTLRLGNAMIFDDEHILTDPLQSLIRPQESVDYRG